MIKRGSSSREKKMDASAIGGGQIFLSSHVRVMKEKRGREIRRFYFFLEGKVLRNGEEKEKKDSSGNLYRVVSSIESRTIVSLEKKEKLDIIIWISYN